MNLRPGMRVLDVGCGVGGPAREIARFADVNIVGLNNNEYQISRATKHVKWAKLDDRISFVKGDFMKLSEQFGENSFDAGMYLRLVLSICTHLTGVLIVYAIEATVHAPSWEGVYSEIKKVLKPGGIVSVLYIIFSQ